MYKKGDVLKIDFGLRIGHEQSGIRPVMVISNNIGNKHAPVITVACFTSSLTKHNIPTHVPINKSAGLDCDSVLMLEQTLTIDKDRVISYLGRVDYRELRKVNNAIRIAFDV